MPTPFLLNGILASQISGHLYSGPAGAFDALGSVTVGSGGLSSITFSAIPQTYTHLQISGQFRDSSSNTGDAALWIQFNGDSGSNYAWHRLWGNGSSASAGASTSQTWGLLGVGTYGGDTANAFGSTIADVLDYANTNKTKVARALTGDDTNGAGYIGLHSTLWNNTNAINQITLFPPSGYNFATGTNFSLYGIR